MNEIAERISRLMSETNTIAASLDSLARRLEREGDPVPTAAEVVTAVLQHPTRYRLFDPMRGAWIAGGLHQAPGPYGTVLAEHYVTPCPWLVRLDCDDADDAHGDPLVRWSRRTLAYLARSLDPKSPSAVNRWFLLLREHRRLREARNAAGLRLPYSAVPVETRRKVPAHQPSSASSFPRRNPRDAAS